MALQGKYPEVFRRARWQWISQCLCWGALAAFVVYGLWRFEATPERLLGGLGEIGVIANDMFPPSFGGAERELVMALGESLAMAFMGTLIASVLAFPLGILGARNVLPNWVFHFVLRRHFDAVRGVDPLVWALVYVRAVGLGPIAGTLAIATSDMGTLSKLYAEAIESAEKRQADGVRAAGASEAAVVRLGILPQVLPVMLSNTLYMFESNTRSATILGIVGAGGIGFQLSDRIRAHRWDEVSMIILMIIALVACIDLLSHFARKRLIEGRGDGRKGEPGHH